MCGGLRRTVGPLRSPRARGSAPPPSPPPPPLQFLNTGKLSALDDLGITPPTSAAAQAAMRFV